MSESEARELTDMVADSGLCPHCAECGSDIELEYHHPRVASGLNVTLMNMAPDELEIIAGCWCCGHAYSIRYKFDRVIDLSKKEVDNE